MLKSGYFSFFNFQQIYRLFVIFHNHWLPEGGRIKKKLKLRLVVDRVSDTVLTGMDRKRIFPSSNLRTPAVSRHNYFILFLLEYKFSSRFRSAAKRLEVVRRTIPPCDGRTVENVLLHDTRRPTTTLLFLSNAFWYKLNS